jgi:hypothetical protein
MAADGVSSVKSDPPDAPGSKEAPAEISDSEDGEEAEALKSKGKGKKSAVAGKRGANKKKPVASQGRNKKGAVADSPAASSLILPTPAPTTQPAVRNHARGFVDVIRLVDLYVNILLTKAVAQASDVSGAAADDECDSRLVLRRLIDDLLVLLDLPEWPVAETILQRIVVQLVDKLPPIAGSGAAESTATSHQSVGGFGSGAPGDRATALLAVQLIGCMLPRLQLGRAYAIDNVLHLPVASTAVSATDPTFQQGRPTDEGENAICVCGRGAGSGPMFMLDCDECHRWYHASCVGVVIAPSYWMCDDCGMRKQLAAFRVSVPCVSSQQDGAASHCLCTLVSLAGASVEPGGGLCGVILRRIRGS